MHAELTSNVPGLHVGEMAFEAQPRDGMDVFFGAAPYHRHHHHHPICTPTYLAPPPSSYPHTTGGCAAVVTGGGCNDDTGGGCTVVVTGGGRTVLAALLSLVVAAYQITSTSRSFKIRTPGAGTGLCTHHGHLFRVSGTYHTGPCHGWWPHIRLRQQVDPSI